MTMHLSTADPIAPHVDANLAAASAAAESAINRTDSKASLLLAFDGAVLAGLVSAADRRLPLAAQLAGGTAVLALATAAVLLLLVVRPNLGGRGRVVREGFPRWAQLTEHELLAAMGEDHRLTLVRSLSALAVTKFRRLTRAVDVILTALALLLVAAVLTVAG
ncbi:Pycsar system effector family protein [Streptomyces sp. NPDC004286]|uniref:Pycsar system effector family protein n=1 Tax=Streptomyces sp. NPDC004286 TaxID=3364696 RepID=UPI003675B2D5